MNYISTFNPTEDVPKSIKDSSIWTKYKPFVDANKRKRHIASKTVLINEPAEIVFDLKGYNNHNDELLPRFEEDYTFLSDVWLNDLFGLDWLIVNRLIITNKLLHFQLNGTNYFRESNIIGLLEMLNALSRIAFIECNRPVTKKISDSNKPVYTSKEVMEMFNVGETTLRKYRDNNLLPYSKAGDKIFYTQEHLREFLQRTDINNQNHYNI